MQKRTFAYAIGGLALSLIFILAVLTSAIILKNYLLWGIVPYTVYLFVLNVLPLEYPQGKTDVGVLVGVQKGGDAEKNMLSAMEIQGQLSEGKTFSEIEETWYMDVPQLCEDEPLFAVLWDLKYHYYLDKNDLEKAADALNRLIVSAPYLTAEAVDSVRIESAYMMLLQKDSSQLKSLLETDEKLLRSDDYRIKRLLATYAYACGDKKKGKALVGQAKAALEKERIVGIRKHELTLLSRLSV